MVHRDQIISFCAELLEPDEFEDHGPNGLQIPGQSEVTRVVTGVTANLELLERAVRSGAELVLTHHGLLTSTSSGPLSQPLAARLKALLCADVSLAAYHLPLDANPVIGNNALLREALGLVPDRRPFARAGGRPIGAVGHAHPPIGVEELARRLADACGQQPLVFDSGPPQVETVGIVTGSGAFALPDAARLELDALVTGEPREAVMGEAREYGIHFLAGGHYATERAGIRRLGELVAERFGVEHEFVDVPNPV